MSPRVLYSFIISQEVLYRRFHFHISILVHSQICYQLLLTVGVGLKKCSNIATKKEKEKNVKGKP